VPAVDDVVPIEMQEFDILITKSKLEKDDKFEDFVNSKIVYKVFFFGGEGVFFRLFVCVLCLLNGLWHANSPNTWVPPLCVAFRKGTLFSCSVAATSRWTACSRTISPLSSCTCPMDTTSTCSAQPSRVPRVSKPRACALPTLALSTHCSNTLDGSTSLCCSHSCCVVVSRRSNKTRFVGALLGYYCSWCGGGGGGGGGGGCCC
jgi:hypothetical protein